MGYSLLKREYWYADKCFKLVRFERRASNTYTMSVIIIESLGGFIKKQKMGMDNWNEHS